MINLIHGDCFDEMSCLADGSVDCVLTDPPYNILNHKIETAPDVAAFVDLTYQKLKKGGFFAFFGRQPTLSHWNNVCLENGLNFKTEIIWYKRQRSSPMGDMGRVFENISIFCKGRRQFNAPRIPYLDSKESLADLVSIEGIKRIFSHLTFPYKTRASWEQALQFLDAVEVGDPSLFYTRPEPKRNENVTLSKAKGRKVKPTALSAVEVGVLGCKPQNLVGFMPHNKLSFDSSGQGEGDFNLKHPTVKPVKLFEWLIQLLTSPGDLILDPFLGTGTTAIACKNQGRQCIGIELEAEYFVIAQDRLKRLPDNCNPSTDMLECQPLSNDDQLSLF